MKFVDVIIPDDILEDAVKPVQDLNPCVQVGTGPVPRLDRNKKIRQVVGGRIEEFFNKIGYVRMLKRATDLGELRSERLRGRLKGTYHMSRLFGFVGDLHDRLSVDTRSPRDIEVGRCDEVR